MASLALDRELAHEVADEGVAAEGADVRARYGEHLAEEGLRAKGRLECEVRSNYLNGSPDNCPNRLLAHCCSRTE